MQINVLVSASDPLQVSIRHLLSAYQSETTQLRVRYIDPDRKPAEFLAFKEKYGLLVGRTPLALKGKEGDIVVVTLSAPGYAKMERKILLSRQLSELKLELEKAKAVKPKPSTKDLKDPYSNELVDDPY